MYTFTVSSKWPFPAIVSHNGNTLFIVNPVAGHIRYATPDELFANEPAVVEQYRLVQHLVDTANSIK